MKIRPKTKDWLRGWRTEALRRRESAGSASPTANSRLLEESFDFSSLDYESEGEWAQRAPPFTSESPHTKHRDTGEVELGPTGQWWLFQPHGLMSPALQLATEPTDS